MKKHFQFCFCKIFEDNKIPYQKHLMLLQSCHCLFHILAVDEHQADNSKGFSVNQDSKLQRLAIVKCMRFLPFPLDPSRTTPLSFL